MRPLVSSDLTMNAMSTLKAAPARRIGSMTNHRRNQTQPPRNRRRVWLISGATVSG
jgi:hypothetical protein